MAFRFPNVYDALYIESLAKKKGPISRAEYNRGVREATFLGLQKTYPYLVETFTDLEDPTKGDIYAATSQGKVANILYFDEAINFFPPGKVNINTYAPITQQSVSTFMKEKKSRSFKPTNDNEYKGQLKKISILAKAVDKGDIKISKDVLFGNK